jgi:MerR family transcriptional regulator, heat shock protein HspR
MRMYERAGLIVPFKKSTNQRLYSDEDIKRLRCVRKAINEDKISIEGIRRILSLTPCWAVVRCPVGDREKCPAYLGHAQPCWSMDRKAEFCKARDCRTCKVYNDLGDCQSIKESLKKLLPQ